MRILPATDLDGKLGTELAETPDFEHAREWARQVIEDLVDDDGVEFVGQRPWRAIAGIVGHVPAQLQRPLGIGLRQVNGDHPALCEMVNGEPRSTVSVRRILRGTLMG